MYFLLILFSSWQKMNNNTVKKKKKNGPNSRAISLVWQKSMSEDEQQIFNVLIIIYYKSHTQFQNNFPFKFNINRCESRLTLHRKRAHHQILHHQMRRKICLYIKRPYDDEKHELSSLNNLLIQRKNIFFFPQFKLGTPILIKTVLGNNG